MAKKKGKGEKGITQCSIGTVLFREGETGTKMYVIKSGKIRMSKQIYDTSVTIEELGAGDFCGEIALVTNQARTTTAMVVKEATVIQIDASQFENMLRSNSDIAVRMMKRMAQRLIEAQFRIANFTLRTTKARLLHQLRNEAERRDAKLRTPAPIPDDLAAVLALEFGEVKVLLGELVRDELISIDKKGFFNIIDPRAYERYLKYLELHDHFEFRHG